MSIRRSASSRVEERDEISRRAPFLWRHGTDKLGGWTPRLVQRKGQPDLAALGRPMDPSEPGRAAEGCGEVTSLGAEDVQAHGLWPTSHSPTARHAAQRIGSLSSHGSSQSPSSWKRR